MRVIIYLRKSLLCQAEPLLWTSLAPLPVTMSNYPVPPPAYGPASPQKNSNVDETREPLLASSSRGGGGGFYDQPDQSDLPDDFKVGLSVFDILELHSDRIWLQYGVSVSESSPEIRNAFIRKVYTILRE